MEKISAHIPVNGFESILYPVNNRKNKVIIVVSGSRETLQIAVHTEITILIVKIF